MISLCNENDFSVSVQSGSIDYSHSSYLGTKKYFDMYKDMKFDNKVSNKRRRTTFGVNTDYYDLYYEHNLDRKGIKGYR